MHEQAARAPALASQALPYAACQAVHVPIQSPVYIRLLQVLPPGARIISIEKELSWVLVAKRFLWQASQGSKASGAQQKVGDKVRGLGAAGRTCAGFSCRSAEQSVDRMLF